MHLHRRARLTAVTLLALGALGVSACGTTVRDSDVVGAPGSGSLSAEGGQATGAGTTGAGTAAGTTGALTGGSTGASAGTTGTTGVVAGTTGGTGGTGAGSTGAGTTGTATTGTTGAGTSTTTGTTGKPGTPGGPTTPAGPAAQTSGPGKLAPVEVGIVYVPDADQFAALFGGSAKVGDQKVEAMAAVKWVNDNGGLGGHPIIPVFHSQSVTDVSPYSTSMAAICSDFTEDHKVVASLFIGANVPDDLAKCLSAKKVLHMTGGNYVHDGQSYRETPYLVSPYESDLERATASLMKNLDARRWIGPKDRVGVMLINEAAAVRSYKNVVVPALKAKGVPFASYNADFPSSTTAVAQSLQQVQSAQLKMKTDGVTKVIFLAPGSEATFFAAADQQKYKPGYALMSISGPFGLQERTTFPKSQLAGTVGIGWFPIADTGASGVKDYPNPAKTTCRSIMAATGQISNKVADFASLQWCDGLFSLRAAAIAAGSTPTLNGDALVRGFGNLGTSYTSTLMLGTSFSPTKRAGAGTYRPLSFSAACTCFAYDGPAVPFS